MKRLLMERGSMFLEIVIASGLLLMAAVSFIPLFTLANNTTRLDSQKTSALAVAEQQINVIKSLAYDNVGLVGGNPDGVVNPESQIVSNDIQFTITNRVRWIDDSSDGTTPVDQDPRDYKLATVKVSWESPIGQETITQVAKISRQSEQQLSTNGHLLVYVRDTESNLVENVKVDLTDGPAPFTPQSQYTDDKGEAFFADLKPSVVDGDYLVSISKAGFVARPDQAILPITIIARDTRVIDFVMARPGKLKVTLVDPLGEIINANCKLTLTNSYPGQTEYSFLNDGNFEITNLFPITWGVEPYVPSYEYLGDPIIADITPGTTQNLVITMTPKASGDLHLLVTDDVGAPLPDVDVMFSSLDTTQTISQLTDADGTIDITLDVGTWEVQATKTGFQQTTVSTDITTGTNSLTIDMQANAEPGSVRIRTERASDHRRRKNKRVYLDNDAIGYHQSKYTNGQGYAVFKDLTPGAYIAYRNRHGKYDPRNVDVVPGVQSEVVYSW